MSSKLKSSDEQLMATQAELSQRVAQLEEEKKNLVEEKKQQQVLVNYRAFLRDCASEPNSNMLVQN